MHQLSQLRGYCRVSPVFGFRRWFLLFVSAAISCADPTNSRMSIPEGEFKVELDTTAGQLAPAARAAEEARAIESLVARAPESHRAELRRFLSKRDVTYATATDAETARLLSIIMSMRIADQAAATSAPGGPARNSAPMTRSDSLASDQAVRSAVVVRIALVQHLPKADGNARAVIRRMPGDRGMPLILLDKQSTAGDLERAFRAGIAMHDRYGESPEAPAIMRLRHVPTSKDTASKRAAKGMAYLQKAKIESHPEIGPGQLVYVSLHRH
jgi:hypothetical protein